MKSVAQFDITTYSRYQDEERDRGRQHEAVCRFFSSVNSSVACSLS